MSETLTACLIVKNEARRLAECLERLRWADEILVVDDESGDGTSEVARRFTEHVLRRPLHGDFAAQRNFALDHAHGEWVLFVDADEHVSAPLRDEIRLAIGQAGIAGYRLRRHDVNFGRVLRYGESRVRLLRLGRRTAGRWQGRVHETWDVTGPIATLREPLLHYSHPDISTFLRKLDYHTTLAADRLAAEGRGAGAWQLVTHPVASFLRNYIARQGFRDGSAGFVFAVLMSLHPFLARAKLRERRHAVDRR